MSSTSSSAPSSSPAVPARCHCHWTSPCAETCKCRLAGVKCSSHGICHPKTNLRRRYGCKNTPLGPAPEGAEGEEDEEDECKHEKEDAEGEEAVKKDAKVSKQGVKREATEEEEDGDEDEVAVLGQSSSSSSAMPAYKKRKTRHTTAVATKVKEKTTEEAGEDAIFFKSTNANGFAFLSNFWPTVDTKAKNAVLAKESSMPTHPPPAAAPVQELYGNNPLHPFTIDGLSYATVEHYYQSVKFLPHHKAAAESIRNAPTGVDAKKLNTKFKKTHPAPREWFTHANQVKVMHKAVSAKFQNPSLRALLLSTGKRILHETRGRTRDIWSFQPEDPEGTADQLGKILMRVREEIASEQKS